MISNYTCITLKQCKKNVSETLHRFSIYPVLMGADALLNPGVMIRVEINTVLIQTFETGLILHIDNENYILIILILL